MFCETIVVRASPLYHRYMTTNALDADNRYFDPTYGTWTTVLEPEQGTVQYFDATWGGWRNLTAFGDAPRDTWAISTAKRKARELSGGRSTLMSRTRVLNKMSFVAEYRNGVKIR